MSDTVNARELQVYDPPMCCSSGVCGPNVDPKLVRFQADLKWMSDRGVQVERFNPAHEHEAFVRNATVVDAINTNGQGCLPLILVDGEIVSRGGYPDRAELAALVGLDSEAASE